jgi:hypothetical protein
MAHSIKSPNDFHIGLENHQTTPPKPTLSAPSSEGLCARVRKKVYAKAVSYLRDTAAAASDIIKGAGSLVTKKLERIHMESWTKHSKFLGASTGSSLGIIATTCVAGPAKLFTPVMVGIPAGPGAAVVGGIAGAFAMHKFAQKMKQELKQSIQDLENFEETQGAALAGIEELIDETIDCKDKKRLEQLVTRIQGSLQDCARAYAETLPSLYQDAVDAYEAVAHGSHGAPKHQCIKVQIEQQLRSVYTCVLDALGRIDLEVTDPVTKQGAAAAFEQSVQDLKNFEETQGAALAEIEERIDQEADDQAIRDAFQKCEDAYVSTVPRLYQRAQEAAYFNSSQSHHPIQLRIANALGSVYTHVLDTVGIPNPKTTEEEPIEISPQEATAKPQPEVADKPAARVDTRTIVDKAIENPLKTGAGLGALWGAATTAAFCGVSALATFTGAGLVAGAVLGGAFAFKKIAQTADELRAKEIR